jgi:SNF2 family DNA or RNA helicase
MRGIIGMAVVDEIHKCKNAQSQQGKAIHCLKTKFKLALTGTPLMNQAMDLYNIMKWLEVEKNSFYQFRARYCIMGGYVNYQIVGYKNMDELRTRFGKMMLRRKKDEVLNLPPKIRSTDYVDMMPKQAQLYKEVKNMLKANIKEIELNPNPLAMLIRLRQVTAHTSILSDSIAESAKMERLKEIVDELVENGHKAIIFSNWEEVAQIVKSELSQYNPAYITGSIKDRQAEVERFQEDAKCKVIIGTVGAMGTGLTLTKASTVIFMDKAWNMATVEQAEDRAHRIGTTGTVNIISLVCKDTIDENIEAIVESKKFLAEELVDGASNGSKAEQLKLIYQILGEE